MTATAMHRQAAEALTARIVDVLSLEKDDPQKPRHYESLLNDAEAARFLGGLHPKTVQRMARRGEISHYRVGKYYRYRASELSAWLVLHSSGQNHPPAPNRKEIQ
jgi:excisionase family DNA binding protein